MKTYYEIIGEKSYRQLTKEEKDEIQDRQTELVLLWQDQECPMQRDVIFDELHDSIKGLVKEMAYRQANKSFSVGQDDFEGIIYLVLIETLITFDRELDKPFNPVFILNVRNAIKMMYREKGYDLHDTTDRLDEPIKKHNGLTLAEVAEAYINPVLDCETDITTNQMLDECFGKKQIKKTIVHMSVQGCKRNEIVSSLLTKGKTKAGMERYVNRTMDDFKGYYTNLS